MGLGAGTKSKTLGVVKTEMTMYGLPGYKVPFFGKRHEMLLISSPLTCSLSSSPTDQMSKEACLRCIMPTHAVLEEDSVSVTTEFSRVLGFICHISGSVQSRIVTRYAQHRERESAIVQGQGCRRLRASQSRLRPVLGSNLCPRERRLMEVYMPRLDRHLHSYRDLRVGRRTLSSFCVSFLLVCS
jgi:hypothetical protein